MNKNSFSTSNSDDNKESEGIAYSNRHSNSNGHNTKLSDIEVKIKEASLKAQLAEIELRGQKLKSNFEQIRLMDHQYQIIMKMRNLR